MGSNLLTKSSSMRPLSTSAVSRFCNDIPPDQDSAKTNTKIEDKEKKDSAITDTKKAKVYVFDDWMMTGYKDWKKKNPHKSL